MVIRSAGLLLAPLLLAAAALSCGENTREPETVDDSRPADQSDAAGDSVPAGSSEPGAGPASTDDPLPPGEAGATPEVSLDSLQESCRASPGDFQPGRRYLLESLKADRGAECFAVLRELEAGHAAAWVPPYLMGE